MKMPSMRTVERVIGTVKSVKDLVDIPYFAEKGLLGIIKKQEKELHDKKAEICKLREDIEDLKENLDNCIYTINKLRGTYTTKEVQDVR